MRYESRHAFFKRAAVKANNYKNIAFTLATRYQLKQCLLLAKPIFYDDSVRASGLKKTKTLYFSARLVNFLNVHFGQIDVERDLFECTLLSCNHMGYHQSSVYVIELECPEERPVFVQIMRIVRAQTNWMLLVDRLRTKCYNDDLCAWQIETVEDFSLLDPLQLRYFHKGLDVYEINGSSYVCLTSRLTKWNQNDSSEA
jgi:hypothetical protein